MDIVALLSCLHPCLTRTTFRQLCRITLVLLTMTGRVTMLGIARWTERGGSYRTVQRFFSTSIPWPTLNWFLLRQHILTADDVFLLAADETVVTKAGTHTFGLARFFSSLAQRPVPSVAFFSIALVSTRTRRAFPLRLDQVVRTPAVPGSAPAPPLKRSPGRPKGATRRTPPPLSPELQRIQAALQAQQQVMGTDVALTYLALDGHFGNGGALQMVRACNLHIISKLRSDAALYLPYAGPYAGRGAPRIYGPKLDYQALPPDALQQTTWDGEMETRRYHLTVLHKHMSQPIAVVILVKTNVVSKKQGHVVLFTSDLTLDSAQVVDYYSLRFQIEFTFRDAKQFWGLEDWMTTQETRVTNAANLALFMVNVALVLLQTDGVTHECASVLDLKACFRGAKYATETINLLPEKPEPHIIIRIVQRIACFGRINPPERERLAA